MTLTLGRTVLYTLAEEDAVKINKRRDDYKAHLAKYPGYEGDGSICHVGNAVRAGDVFPAVAVRVFEQAGSANLQVTLDGTDTFWACSVSEGTGGRTWAWPTKV